MAENNRYPPVVDLPTPCISAPELSRLRSKSPPPLAHCSQFRFIELSGFYFGFLLGCVQAAIWWLLLEFRSTLEDSTLLPLWWFLPAAGAICGYVTNAVALGIIFNPIEPIHVCGLNAFRLHGLFLQRQAEVSEEFATITSSRVITAKHCWERILFGNRRERFESMVLGRVTRAIDEQVGALRPFVPLLMGSSEYRAAPQQAAELLLQELPSCLMATYTYTEDAMGMQQLLAGRMKKLPSSEFERVLHPAFEEDEWKLIAVGGLLGLAVGVFQVSPLIQSLALRATASLALPWPLLPETTAPETTASIQLVLNIHPAKWPPHAGVFYLLRRRLTPVTAPRTSTHAGFLMRTTP